MSSSFGGDAFVALPPATKDGVTLFAKNSRRPNGEVQEVIYVPASNHISGSKVQCTYIEIEQACSTHAVYLSKPSWMWGAEMGSNEHGVCIGLSAVKTKLLDENDREERLLGHDLLRLGLERASTAKGSVEVISTLLEQHGQGGNWQDSTEYVSFHSSFLIVDQSEEAWVFETAGKLWAAKKLEGSIYGITSSLTLDTTFDAVSADMQDVAQSKSLWKAEDGEINFQLVFGDDVDTKHLSAGLKLLEAKKNAVDLRTMLQLLRDPSLVAPGIEGSMVCLLSPATSQIPCFHFVTATRDPTRSVFKPFVFTSDVNFSRCTVSPSRGEDDPAETDPCFRRQVDRRHQLGKAHEGFCTTLDDDGRDTTMETMLSLEEEVMKGIDEIYIGDKKYRESDFCGIFNDCVETEMKFYL